MEWMICRAGAAGVVLQEYEEQDQGRDVPTTDGGLVSTLHVDDVHEPVSGAASSEGSILRTKHTSNRGAGGVCHENFRHSHGPRGDASSSCVGRLSCRVSHAVTAAQIV